ncbi:MAG: GtrA family protein [Halobacteriales archaeon]
MGRTRLVPTALRSWEQVLKFALVGGLGYLIDQGVILVVAEGLGVTLELAKVVSAETAIVVMFLINDRWTFASWGDDDYRSKLRRLVRSNLVRIGGIAVAVAVLSVLVRYFDVPLLVANTVGIGCGFVVNYTFETLFTWRVGRR